MTDEQILEILETWSDEFNVADIIASFFRWLGFGIAKGIAGLAAELEDLAKKIYTLLPELIADTEVGNFINEAKPLLTVLLGLSIMAAGYIIIVKKDGKANVLQNFLILFVVITVMPLMSGKVATLTMGASQGIFGITEQGSAAAYDVIDDNIADLYMLMEEDRLTSSEKDHDRILKSKDKNVISPDKMSVASIKIKSTLDYDENNFGYYDKLTKREIDVSPSGQPYLVKLNGGIFDATHDYYYRYHVNWFVMLTSLIAMFITLGLTCIRLAKMLWEIIMDMFIAPFVAVTDVATGQRIKELLRNFLSLFAVMGIISVIIGVYNLGMRILSTWQSTGKIGGVVYLVLLISLAILTIDGPSIIQRIYGIDAGGKGPLAMLSGLYYGSRMAKEAAKAPVKMAATGVALGKKGYNTVSDLKKKATKEKQKSEQIDHDSVSSPSAPATGGKGKTTYSSNKAVAKDEPLHSRETARNTARSAPTSRSNRKPEPEPKTMAASAVGLGAASALSQNGSKQNPFAHHSSSDANTKTPLSSGRTQAKGSTKGRDVASGNSSQSLRSISLRKGSVSSPKVNGVKFSANSGKMPTLSSIKNKPLTSNKQMASRNDTYQTTDNRIISSLRSKDGFEGGSQQNIVQQKAKPERNVKSFGQRRTLK